MEHVSYGYEGRSRALQDVSLTIPRGSSVALVGLSGCGKSTAASLLMRFCDPDQGTIFIEGKEYRSVTPQQFRTNIAMVPQQVNLFSGTIRENLLLADPNANDEKLKEALSESCDHQPFITKAPMVLVFCADCKKWYDACRSSAFRWTAPKDGNC